MHCFPRPQPRGNSTKVMADFIFNCPACKQAIQADDAWAGQQIHCPLCKAGVMVPGGNPVGAKPSNVPRMSYSSGHGAVQPPKAGMSPALKYSIVGVVFVASAVGGWLGWPYLSSHVPFLKGSEPAPPATAAAPRTPGSAPGERKSPDAPPTEPAPAPRKEVPMSMPSHNLEIGQVTISEGKLNGMIAGTKFVPDNVLLSKLPTGYVLNLRQGTGQSPDLGLAVFLQMAPTESPTGHTWTVAQDLKGTAVNRVLKIWKPNPKYAAQQKTFATGFALKLEFGQLTESNTLPGKLYVALPDTEKSVIGGVFTATTALTGAATPTETAAPNPKLRDPRADAEFQKRYGVKPR